MADPLQKLYRRLKTIGITINCIANYPWIYLTSVNGNAVKEKFMAQHGFTIATLSFSGHKELTDTKKIFEIIRKYR